MHTIEIYTDFVYRGFWQYNKIEQLMRKYSHEAAEMSNQIENNEIILYAILGFDKKSHALLTADFMLLRMDYEQYAELANKIHKNCRLFFKTNTGGYND